ncbi:glutathione S-transferase family protein [Flexibacterium corallicola]|uniref:glutathione S-transferase family protein n=1 Tax=Flexibacterium corallicola TaxID=3037259 RepID=UPI00286FA636|nr:glutathione S-transferase family protein [Pseudovibrio sp. M1P-2-3]
MLILRSSPASPFGRKIKIAASVLGLEENLSIELADTNSPTDSLRQQNPLGKIPAMITEDDTVLYDSRVITEYLDFISEHKKILPSDASRFELLTKQALADGICDAAILLVVEKRVRPQEKWFDGWLNYQQEKIDRALTTFENGPLHFVAHNSPDAAQIALACALGYLDLRFEGKWRESYPNLLKWLNDFEAAVPSFEATRMQP